MSITCTITRAGRFDEYGRPLTVAQSYTGTYDFVKSLVQSGYATTTLAMLDDDEFPFGYVQASVPAGTNAAAAYADPRTGGLSFSAGDKTYAPDGTPLVSLAPLATLGLCAFGEISNGVYLCMDTPNGDFGRRLFTYNGDPVVGGGVVTPLTNTSVAVGNALKNTLGVAVGHNSNGISNAWVASNGDIWFVGIDVNFRNYLWRAKAGTYTVGSDGAYTNKQASIDLGLNGGTHTPYIRGLSGRSFLEATVNNAKHYYFCEYNVASPRTAGAGGAGGDQCIVWRSTDLGNNWSVFLEFNTGGSHVIDHFHGAVQDPYTGWIYFMTGDNGAECAVIGYNGTAAAPAANTALATLATTAGFKVINGGELRRYTDLCFSELGIYSLPDCDIESADTTSTAFVSTFLPRTLDHVLTVSPVDRVTNIAPILAVMGDGYSLFASFKGSSPVENYFHIWASNSKTGGWTLVAKVRNYASIASIATPQQLWIDSSDRLWFVGQYGLSVQFTSAVASGSSVVFALKSRDKTYITHDGA